VPRIRGIIINPDFVDCHKVYAFVFVCSLRLSYALNVDCLNVTFSCSDSKTAGWYQAWLRQTLQ